MRREHKWSASRIAFQLHGAGTPVGRIPNGGGWRVHGKDSEHAKALARTKTRGTNVLASYS